MFDIEQMPKFEIHNVILINIDMEMGKTKDTRKYTHKHFYICVFVFSEV